MVDENKKPDLDDFLKEIMARDPLAEVESGQHLLPDPDLEPPPPPGTIDDRDTFNGGASESEKIIHSLKVNALKKAAMITTGDTIYGDDLSRYLSIVNSVGFKVVLELPFSVKQCYDELHRNERLFVLWRPDGVLLVFDTYEGDRVNSGHIYYNWLANEPGDRHGATSSGGYVLPPGKSWRDVQNNLNLVWAGDHDCRIGLRLNLRQLEKHGKFLAKWVQRPFLWLLHYGDHADHKPYDYNKINAERIAMLPPEVQEAITPGTTPC